MHFQLSVFAALAALASSAAAATLKIEVGANNQLVFTPNTQVAAVGDILEFHFNPKSHSVAQSSWASPCFPIPGGFFSGLYPVDSGEGPEFYHVTVNDTNPIWYYCSQTNGKHCQGGMVGAINPPATGNTFALFQAAAAKTGASVAPPVVEGGVSVANPQYTPGATAAGGGGGANPTTGSSAATTSKSEGTAVKSFRLAQVVGWISCVGGVALFL